MNPPLVPAYEPKYYPLHIALLTCGENLTPMGSWLVISKEPFRFIIAMQKGNHTLSLLRKYGEAALHFMPWRERERACEPVRSCGAARPPSSTSGTRRRRREPSRR